TFRLRSCVALGPLDPSGKNNPLPPRVGIPAGSWESAFARRWTGERQAPETPDRTVGTALTPRVWTGAGSPLPGELRERWLSRSGSARSRDPASRPRPTGDRGLGTG